MAIAYVTITTLMWCGTALAASREHKRGLAAFFTLLAAVGVVVLFGLHA